ncbi:MAG: hypothetical protein CM15mP65_07930 [Crocinitomicaceae bacterium]|nr:MAG: hypothetical protein CM15mP65_07930 [Crocinitomicaceae bacterium]
MEACGKEYCFPGHADHSKWGHQHYLTHLNNVPIIKHRLGDISTQGVNWGDVTDINGVKFSLHPAGHVVGSSQVKVEHKGEVWVFTGTTKERMMVFQHHLNWSDAIRSLQSVHLVCHHLNGNLKRSN